MKILVMPNQVPYNDMVFDGHLRVGKYSVKTRSYNLNYRGPVLFYNSTRTEPKAMAAYDYGTGFSSHKTIIGMADLVKVRPLKHWEAKKMVENFNNLPQVAVTNLFGKMLDLIVNDKEIPDFPFLVNEMGLIAPFRNGLFFLNEKRFEKPVPFKWPTGPVRPIFIESARHPKIHAQLLLSGSVSLTYKTH